MSECLDSTVDLVPVQAEDPFPQDKQGLDTPAAPSGRSTPSTTVK
jgi:hypothetical protein